MDSEKQYKLLKIYISEDSKYKKHSLCNELVSKFKELKIAGVTVTRGIEGYGQQKILHTIRILDLSSSLPIIIEVVDTTEKIEEALPVVKEMVNEGLVMTVDVNVIKLGNKSLEIEEE